MLKFTTFDSVGVPDEVIERNVDIWVNQANVRMTGVDRFLITEDDGRVIRRFVVYYEEN